MKILIAEDDPRLNELIARFLERKGHEVTTVENGEALLAALEVEARHEFNLVITDNSMPLMTGIEALRRIRGSIMHHDLPVIMYSADVGVIPEVTSLEATFVDKARSMGDLLFTVGKIEASMKTTASL